MVKILGQRGYKWDYISRFLKSLNCIKQGLLLAKPAAYAFDYQSLRTMGSFLSNRQQGTKINNAFNRNFSEIIYGVPQESILCPLLFNIYMCDMFFNIIECDIASYADNKIP